MKCNVCGITIKSNAKRIKQYDQSTVIVCAMCYLAYQLGMKANGISRRDQANIRER